MRAFIGAMYVMIGLGAASAEYRDNGDLNYATMAILLWPIAIGNQLWTERKPLSNQGYEE